MKEKWYINRIAFRILFPALAGLILYLALLMVFGNLEDLSGSFFSQEALFLVVLTYVVHEWTIFLLGRERSKTALNSGILVPKVMYFIVILTSTVLISTGIILVYFLFIIGYNYFITELITINILLVLFQGMVHLYYISMMNIRHSHKLSMEQEEIQGQQLELELESFKSEMNPGLLMECLESLITIMKMDTDESEKYIQSLSNQYRYLLDNRNKEFVDMEDEIEAVHELVYLLNNGGSAKLILETEIENLQQAIIPGTLHNIIYQIENSMILNPMNPMKVIIQQEKDGAIRITHENQPKIIQGEPLRTDKLNQSYDHYTGRRINREPEGSVIVWTIPGLPEILDE